MDCSPPGSSVLEIFRARILEWVNLCNHFSVGWASGISNFPMLHMMGHEVGCVCVGVYLEGGET